MQAGRYAVKPGILSARGALAAAAATVAAAAVVVYVNSKPVAAAAAQQNEVDDESRAVSVTHGKASFQITLYLLANGVTCYSIHFFTIYHFKTYL